MRKFLRQLTSFAGILLLAFSAVFAQAQIATISGVVKDAAGSPLSGASVTVEPKNIGATTDVQGSYSLKVPAGSYTLVISFVGFSTQRIPVSVAAGASSVQDVNLTAASSNEGVTVIGSRSTRRVATETAVPVDIINMSEFTKAAPQVNINQILNYVAPSFTSNTTTVADGTDHIDPAQLRGLGPDQVLVLVNGKRRHTSSLVNVNGSPGRGSVGTDLNAMPAFAIERIEVLRDGAAAQYGSDAIAGVINVVMKKNIGKLNASIYGGFNQSSGSNNHRGGIDGQNYQIDLNYGIGVGKKGGVINLTASGLTRGDTRRATDYNGTIFNTYNAIEERARRGGANLSGLFSNITNTPNTAQIISTIKQYAPAVGYLTPGLQTSIQGATTIATLQGLLGGNVTNDELAFRGLQRKDFNMRVGQSKLASGQLFMNTVLPINDKTTFYTFGGYSYRDGNSAGFYRRPVQPNGSTAVYPNGFLPEIGSVVSDASIAAGIRGKLGSWNYDLSNTFGQNQFKYTVENTINATLGLQSPTSFNAGKLGFLQNTSNLDISHEFDVLSGLNLAFGGEVRVENYKLTAGDPNSYTRYDINGVPATATTVAANLPTDFFNAGKGGGAQVFPGFRPENALSEGRVSEAGYLDVELNVNKAWLVDAAMRYENYSDFGSTFTYKLATRVKVAKGLNARASFSTGFRAPSLQQKFFNSTATQFIGGVPFEVGTFTNTSTAAEKLGIPTLKQEDSYSYSAGFTYKVPNSGLTFTVDGYFVKIKNRVVLTGQFARPSGTVTGDALILQGLFDAVGANAATFFTNAINTESKGIDFIVSNRFKFDGFTLKTDLAGTVSNTRKVGATQASPILQRTGNINRYFDEASRVYLEEAIPRTKVSFMNTVTAGKFDIFLRQTFFGKVTDPNLADANGDGILSGKYVNGFLIANEHPVWGARTITDLSIGYKISDRYTFTVGANNIFDIYPDKNLKTQTITSLPNNAGTAYVPPSSSSDPLVGTTPTSGTIDLSNANQFEYSRNTSQFGQNGRFIFVRFSISL